MEPSPLAVGLARSRVHSLSRWERVGGRDRASLCQPFKNYHYQVLRLHSAPYGVLRLTLRSGSGTLPLNLPRSATETPGVTWSYPLGELRIGKAAPQWFRYRIIEFTSRINPKPHSILCVG